LGDEPDPLFLLTEIVMSLRFEISSLAGPALETIQIYTDGILKSLPSPGAGPGDSNLFGRGKS